MSLIAGIASYFHALTVVQGAGATAPVSYLVPALADLVILGASADLLAASRARLGRPKLTMVSLGVGIVVTLAMNVAAGWPQGWGSRLVAGWPALAFILALESLAGLVRRGRGGASPRSTGAAPAAAIVTVGCGHGVSETIEERIVEAYMHLRDCLGATPSFRDLGRAFGVHHDTAGQLVKAAVQNTPAGMAMAVAPHIPGRGPGGHDGPRAAAGDTPAGDASTPLCSPAGAPDRGQGGLSAVPRRAEQGSRPESHPAGAVAPVIAPAGATLNGGGR